MLCMGREATSLPVAVKKKLSLTYKITTSVELQEEKLRNCQLTSHLSVLHLIFGSHLTGFSFPCDLWILRRPPPRTESFRLQSDWHFRADFHQKKSAFTFGSV